MANKIIHIIGGGTVFHVRSHLALCAPAYGTVARELSDLLEPLFDEDGSAAKRRHNMDVELHLTRMAGGEKGLETNADIAALADKIVDDPASKMVFMTAALCDYKGYLADSSGLTTESYRDLERPHGDRETLYLIKEAKVLRRFREKRKDIFLVAFKNTCGLSENEQYAAAMNLLKASSANLVLANDVKTRLNMVVTPEEARYHVTANREEALEGLVDMALKRSHLTFTRSTVVAGDPVPWDSPQVPEALRAVVNHCIGHKAYKPFRGATVGHFAAKISDNEFLTSIRKSNFNDIEKNGLVRIKTDGPDSVMAYGAKPSVGGQSQRIVFHEHQDYDCIVHFHCPLKDKPRDDIPVASQREYECGSHQCGQNTSSNLKRFGNLSCVMLDQHGPNIVFHNSIDPAEVIAFIEANFELEKKTGGYLPSKSLSEEG